VSSALVKKTNRLTKSKAIKKTTKVESALRTTIAAALGTPSNASMAEENESS